MADNIDVANDLFGTAALKPTVGEEINALWGRNVARNIGELWSQVMFKPVQAYSIVRDNVAIPTAGENTETIIFDYYGHGSRGTASGIARVACSNINDISGTLWINASSGSLVANSDPVAGGTITFGTIAHGVQNGRNNGTLTITYDTSSDNAVANLKFSLFEWGTP